MRRDRGIAKILLDEGCDYFRMYKEALPDGVEVKCVNCPFDPCIRDNNPFFTKGERRAYTQGIIDAILKHSASWVSEGFNAGLKLGGRK